MFLMSGGGVTPAAELGLAAGAGVGETLALLTQAQRLADEVRRQAEGDAAKAFEQAEQARLETAAAAEELRQLTERIPNARAS